MVQYLMLPCFLACFAGLVHLQLSDLSYCVLIIICLMLQNFGHDPKSIGQRSGSH